MGDSMAADKVGLLMWTTDKILRERFADQLSTTEQRPHDNPVLAAKGQIQYRWFRSKLTEQEVVEK